MAIQVLTENERTNGAIGIFTLPHDFPIKKWAVKWFEERAVPSAQQREHVIGCNATADGWAVYKGPDGKATKPHTIKDSVGKTWTLMVRPANIQRQVNALYGNRGKQLARNEQSGITAGGSALQDPGMLPEDRLKPLIGAEDLENAQLKDTPLEEAVAGGHIDATIST